MRRPLPVELLASPLVLRIVGVFDLEPSDVQVHSGRDAPKLAVRATGIEPVGLTGSLSFAARETSAARDPNRRACIAERAGAYYCGPTDTKEMSAIEDHGRFTMRLSRSLQLAWRLSQLARKPTGITRALYSGSAEVHCALIQFSDPVILTATLEKKMCTGASSAML